MILKRFFLISLILLCRIVVDAQYADLGTGTLKNTIWWFNWSGFSISEGASKTFMTNDGLSVTITFSNVSGPIPYPDVMNTWVGAVLPTLYNFSDPTIQPAFYYYQPGPTYTSKFTLNISASRNGNPTPFSFVAADAEASLANEESIDLTTDGSNWNIIDFFRNSTQTTNPVQGCNTKSIIITDTWNGNTAEPIGQNPLMATDASASGNINVGVTLDEEAPTSGGMGIAFGIFEPVDRGDLPASYGYAQHELTYQRNNGCNYLAPLPSLTQSQSLKLGAIAGDPDPIQYTDDNAYDLADEDALNTFPNYDGSGTYTLNVPLVNTTGANVYLTGWFDKNRNGVFDNGESVTVIVPNNSTLVTLSWQGLPNVLPNGSVTNFGFRFRLSSDLAATQSATGFAKDGEVEDYLVPIIFNLTTVTASFTAPDNVCANVPVNVTNTSVGATSYYWSFCAADFSTTPEATNLGNPNNLFNSPVFGSYNLDVDGNYYGLVVNYTLGTLTRLNFGTNLLNTPTATDLGDFGGVIPEQAEGIQVLNQNGNWTAIIVGGGNGSPNSTPRIIKLDFGTSLANTPVATNWGNIGGLNLPHDLFISQESGNYYGFAINVNDNTITRINFGPDFNSTPTGINLGNIGNINYPAGFTFIKYNGNWFSFIANRVTNSITRLNFGASLLNTPTGVNIGNPGGYLDYPRDISLFNVCDGIYGFVVNEQSNEIVKLNFGTNLTSNPQATDLGNIGNLDFPHSISNFFRAGNDIYAFIPNVSNNTLTRIRFAGCQNIPGSNLQNPPAFSYPQPGLYDINLLVDLGLPTETSFCKQILVNNCTTALCTGSLGDPVMNITFGSGANPGQSLPAIVPGASTTLSYVAVTGNPATPTPVDGQYTITNNIPSNPSWFSGATDHTSGNGIGYMAFYNSSELPGEFYHQTVNNLCGSTTYEFAAWIANALNPAITLGVNPNITFSIEQTDGTILSTYNTNDIPQTATFTWNQYGFYFTTPANISTVVLRMINNAPGGNANIGNDFAIDDITFRACGSISTASFNQNLSVDTLKICADTSVTIYGTVSTGYNSPNYLWQVSVDSGKTWTDIPNSNALQLPVISQANQNTKQYNYRLMTAEGNNINSPNCRVASNMTVLFVNALPQGKLTGNTICNGENTTLIFTETDGLSPFNIIYNIGANSYNQSNLNNNASFPVPYQLTDTTTFNLFSITDANGCVDTINAATVVNVNPIPQGGITGNTVCSDDSATIIFTASSGNTPFEIQLSDGTNTTTYYGVQSGKSFNILPIYNTETIYLISIIDQNGNGCARTSGFTYPSTLVTALPSPKVQFDSVPPVCIDQPSFLINEAKEITGSSGSGVFSGQGSDANGNFSPSLAGVGNHIIIYKYTSLNGCDDSASRNVVVNPLPVVNAGSDIITCIGFPVRLNATGATTYSWLPILGLDDPTKSNPIATLDTTTTFIVQGTDPTGCFAYDTITVNVSTKGIAAFQVPNAFTPNGDGLNDCFGIRNWGADITVQEFTIYNRWGQLVFSTKNPSDCWDGTFKGAKQNSGGYPYIIKATSPCGNIIRTGIVMLIR